MSTDCDLPQPNEAHRQLWQQANTFAELCELSARFIEGQIEFHPGWISSQLYEESLPYRGVLASINRGGLLTYMSQPGDAPLSQNYSSGKRAFLSGFMPSIEAQYLREALRYTGLYVAVYRYDCPMLTRFVDSDGDLSRIVVGLNEDGVAFDVGDDRYDAITNFERCLTKCGDGMFAIGEAAFVLIVDHEWGRNNLFELVANAISAIPEMAEISESESIDDTPTTPTAT